MITVEELITWLRAEAEDAEEIEDLRDAAVAYIEEETGLHLGTSQEIVQTFGVDAWPLSLRAEPIDGETFTLERWDGSAWETVSADAYYVEGAFVRQAGGSTVTTEAPARMRATYTAGVATGLAPKPLQVAVKLLVAHWWENREAVNVGNIVNEMPYGLDAILRQYRRVVV